MVHELLTNGKHPISGASHDDEEVVNAAPAIILPSPNRIQFPDYVSQEARSFVSMLLTNDPSLRMPLHMAMQHPFIQMHVGEHGV